MACVDFNNVTIVEKPLHTPPLEELVKVLSAGLLNTFESVAVSAVACPDLTKPPFELTSPGLCGDAKLVELGGPPYLVPVVQRDKLYELTALLRHLRRRPALLAGAGAGPWPYLGTNCEGIINMSVREGGVEQGTRVVWLDETGGYRQQRLPAHETRVALMGNYLLSDGQPGQVLEIEVKKRIGQSNFITAIRETLKEHYGEKVVGLGGTFVARAGRLRHHVMPQFSAAPLCDDAAVEAWLRFFELEAPITHVGTLVTGDLDLDLRVQHFHGWGARGDGGHYHGDTTPAAAHYHAYLVPARAVLRVDRPPLTHSFGRD